MAPNVNLWLPEINSAESIHNLGYPNISNIRLEKRAFRRQKNEESIKYLCMYKIIITFLYLMWNVECQLNIFEHIYARKLVLETYFDKLIACFRQYLQILVIDFIHIWEFVILRIL